MMNRLMKICDSADTLGCEEEEGDEQRTRGEGEGQKKGRGAPNFEPCAPAIHIRPCNQRELKSN